MFWDIPIPDFVICPSALSQPLVIAVTETHLNDSFKDGEIDIPGYRVLRQDRDAALSKKKKGGGNEN